MSWIIGIGLLILLAALIYWTLIITEGAYLGRRFVTWLYDISAHRYNAIKGFQPHQEYWFLARPLLTSLAGTERPLLLDVATGTGRLPLALLRVPAFDGKIVGLDLSLGMLHEAKRHLRGYRERCTLIWEDATSLPFADEIFDAVTCLEALEFFPHPQTALAEMARVLRPGGVLLVTNRINWEARLMPQHAFPRDTFEEMIRSLGMERVITQRWQVYYDLVWARKAGIPSQQGHADLPIAAWLRCPHCHNALPAPSTPSTLWHCPTCGHIFRTQDGILYLHKPLRG